MTTMVQQYRAARYDKLLTSHKNNGFK